MRSASGTTARTVSSCRPETAVRDDRCLTRLDKPFDNTDFSGNATLLLGLVANLDTVSVTSDGHAYSLTSAGASQQLGYDVKELGRDRSRLDAYVAASHD